MNDRFSAQLRQHLLESADERPADGQLAAVIDRLERTRQRPRIAARLTWFPGRVAPFPSTALRYGLVVLALIAATAAAAILGGGSNPLARSTVFEGTWTAIDVPDGSTLTLVVGEGISPVVHFEDDFATGAACVRDEVKLFTADGTGEINGSRLVVDFPDGGGCGLMTVDVVGVYDYLGGRDMLLDQDDLRWTRVEEVADGLATQPTPEDPTGTSECIDLAQGGTYTAPAGPLSLTATVPAKPAISWQGLRDGFNLSGACGPITPIVFHASTWTTVYATSCIPESLEIANFADAVARLDTPKGHDISDRVDLTIGGHAAARYDIVNLSTCPNGFGLWQGSSLGPGETGSVYVIDVDGVLLAIELNRDGNQTPAELEEAWAIIASLQIAR